MIVKQLSLPNVYRVSMRAFNRTTVLGLLCFKILLHLFHAKTTFKVPTLKCFVMNTS